jgi:cellulose synthase operon protein YhjQ
MHVIAVQGIRGGCGTTSVAAGLATGLATLQKHVLLIDLCPSNLLGLHFGLSVSDNTGWAHALAEGAPWQSAAYLYKDHIWLLPFGRPASLSHLHELAADWLSTSLHALDVPDDTYVIFDVPQHTNFREALGQITDLQWIQVMQADPACHALINQQSLVGSLTTPNRFWLINRYQPAYKLSRDLVQLWRLVLGKTLISSVIHEDEAVRESLALKRPIADSSPASLASHNFLSLATWSVALAEAG